MQQCMKYTHIYNHAGTEAMRNLVGLSQCNCHQSWRTRCIIECINSL